MVIQVIKCSLVQLWNDTIKNVYSFEFILRQPIIHGKLDKILELLNKI